MRLLFVSILALTTMACGRIGYGPEDGAADASAPDDTSPRTLDTGVLEDTSVVVDGMTGRVSAPVEAALERGDTVVVLPEHLPEAISGAAAVAAGTTVILAGGSRNVLSTSNCTRDFAVYHPDGSVTTAVDELPVANQGLGLVQVGETLHSVMGLCGGTADEERSVFRHPLGDALPSLVGMFPQGAYFTSAGVIRDPLGASAIIVAGGYGSGPLRDFIQTMNPEDGSAAVLTTTLPSHRCLSASVSGEGAFFVFGGSTHTNCVPPASSATLDMTDEIVRITLEPEAATVVATLPAPVAAACAVELSGGVVALFGGFEYAADPAGGGGYVRQATDRIVMFDRESREAWTHAMRLPAPRAQMSCARTADGRVLLFGGADADGTASDEVLLFGPYEASGVVSGLLDSATAGADWDAFTSEHVAPEGTSIAFAVHTGDDPESLGAWVEVTPGILPAEVLPGRYLEWRATLTTTLPNVTPEVFSVRATFSL